MTKGKIYAAAAVYTQVTITLLAMERALGSDRTRRTPAADFQSAIGAGGTVKVLSESAVSSSTGLFVATVFIKVR